MSGTFRERLVKFGTQILFGVLLLSFVAWGIGDYLGFSGGGGTSRTVAKVGSTSISTRDFQFEMQNQMARMRQVLGDSFGPEQARAMGLEDSVLQSMIQEALFAEGARALGIVVDDSVVAQEIRSDPQFRTVSGGFDRMRFGQVLRELGMSESQYVATMKRELLRTQYLSAVAIGRKAPQAMVDTLYRYRNERRVAQVIVLPHTTVADVAEPTAADLEKYHADHAARFTAPEYRAITVARLRPADVVAEIDVPPARVQAYYEDHLHEFSEPERRTIQQVLYADEKTARDAYARLKAGEDFAKVVKETAGVSGDALTLGTLAKHEVPIPELADAAFMGDVGYLHEPVQSPIGWHLVRVSEINPMSRRSFDEVKDEIRQRIASEMAHDTLYKLSAKFEDELGGGATIEEAAKRLKLPVLKFGAIDRNGRDPEGNGGEGLSPEILRAAFETPQGSDSGMGELAGEGYFMVHVDKVTPQRLKPLEQIKDQVAAAWKAEQRANRAEAVAKQIADDIKGGKLLGDVAAARGAQLVTTQPFTRAREGLNVQLPGALIAALFKSAPGAPEIAPANESHVIAVVSQVLAADPQADPDGVKRVEQELGGAVANDVTVALAAALREKFSVAIDRAAVASAF